LILLNIYVLTKICKKCKIIVQISSIFDKFQQRLSVLNTYERRQSLLGLLRKQPGLRVPEIARALEISEGTVRNDLNALEMEGQLIRVHGGAVLNKPLQAVNVAFGVRHRAQAEAKNAIGAGAAGLIHDGDSILLDASSTAYYLALNLQARNRLRIVTNGLEVARLLAQNHSNMVVLIGGVVNPDGSSVTGLLSEQIIAEFHIQKAFVSCSGFSLERGMTEVYLDEAQLKRKTIESAREVIALVDSSKIGKEDFTPFARVEQISRLITDSGITPQWAQLIERAGIALTICPVAGVGQGSLP
jgi:DeoR/GlpR family transcriptional regulator of sugar metabolism